MKIKYINDNEITNFREICMGNMKKGIIYRGSYPVFRIDPERDRIYDKLISEAGINCVINLAGNASDLEIIANLVPWYNTLLRENNVIGLDIQFEFDFLNTFEYEVFNYKLRQGIEFLLIHKGPYLIHCNAGVDRTGFVAAIIALLCGASIDEIIYDYLLSYGKDFADAKNDELQYITGRNIYGQINAIVNGKIEDRRNLQANIEKYFLKNIGLSKEQLERLKEILRYQNTIDFK
ncbi:MAG: tyrosine-protein phosphatase [Treponema sp.]|nr:tyrosine-protein phosphatase [Treponema sp.]